MCTCKDIWVCHLPVCSQMAYSPILCCVLHFPGSLATGLWIDLANGRYRYKINVQKWGRSQVISPFITVAAASPTWFQLLASPFQVPVLATQPFFGFSSSLTSLASGHTTASCCPLIPQKGAAFCCCWSLSCFNITYLASWFLLLPRNQFFVLNSFCWKT